MLIHVRDLDLRAAKFDLEVAPGAIDFLEEDLRQAGPLTVRVRYTTFWWVTAGSACLKATQDGWTSVDALTVGTIKLSAAVLHPSPPVGCPTH